MPYNLRIPGQFTERELWAIEALAKLVPPGGVVVEVGSFLGMSSYAWAQSVDPSVTVYCIDAWGKDAEYSEKWLETYQTDYSLEIFRSFTEKCPNIVVLQGFSPQDFAEWDKSIDVCCQNICSQNTTFEENISFWSQFVKPDGIICGWGYAEEFPGVMEGVDSLAQFYQSEPAIVDRFWCLVTDGNFEKLNDITRVKGIDGYEYELEIYELPILLEPGDLLKVSGKFKNLSGRDWNVFVDDVEIIKIGIRVYEENKPDRQEFRQAINCDKLIDDGIIDFDFVLDTNQLQQGEISLEFDIVAEFWYWFQDKGAKFQTVEVQILPRTAGNLNKLGNQFKRKGKLVEAIGEYRRAIELNPNFSWSYYNLGDALVKKGNINEAIEKYRQAVNLTPSSALFNYQLSELLAQQEYDDEAVYFWEKAKKVRLNKRFNQSIKSILAKRKLSQPEQQDNNYLFDNISLYLNRSELKRTEKFKKSNFPKRYIFITARYRTGSSYFYYLFSTMHKTAVFYEPLHPQIVSHFLDAENRDAEIAKAIQNHTFRNNYFYFDEYNLLNRKHLIKNHSTSFANSKMLLSSLDRFPQLKTYIKFLISSHKEPKKLKLFQFNRIDFRLAWLKVNFPNALIVNLRRNTRDIYGSYIGVYERVSQEKYSGLNTNLGEFFYLDDYMNFLKNFCWHKINNIELNNYEKIYLINQLSNVWADKFADIVIDYESLVENPVDILSKIVAHIPNFTLNFEEEFIQPRKDRVNIWHNYHSEDWFKECENRCDRLLEKILAAK